MALSITGCISAAVGMPLADGAWAAVNVVDPNRDKTAVTTQVSRIRVAPFKHDSCSCQPYLSFGDRRGHVTWYARDANRKPRRRVKFSTLRDQAIIFGMAANPEPNQSFRSVD